MKSYRIGTLLGLFLIAAAFMVVSVMPATAQDDGAVSISGGAPIAKADEAPRRPKSKCDDTRPVLTVRIRDVPRCDPLRRS